MESLVVDTDVISFFAKADTRAAAYWRELAGRQACICFQTVAELRLWALLRRWGAARQDGLDSLLHRFIILPYDAQTAEHWAQVTAHRRRLGRPIECGDAWIAAAAVRHGSTLVSHNAKDYADVPGLRVITHGH
jgi:predicted nucleic acid-binding protein